MMNDIFYLLMFLGKNTVMPEASQTDLINNLVAEDWREARHIMDEYYNIPVDVQDKMNCKYLLQKATKIRWDNDLSGHGWYYDEESLID